MMYNVYKYALCKGVCFGALGRSGALSHEGLQRRKGGGREIVCVHLFIVAHH